MADNIIHVRKKGSLTLPIYLRKKYNVGEGDVFTLIDLGEGAFLLTPKVSKVNQLGGRIADILENDGVSLDDLLTSLDQERQQYYQDHYAEG